MKTALLSLAAIAALLSSPAAFAAASHRSIATVANPTTANADLVLPHPVSVVHPEGLSVAYKDTVVWVAFDVDPNGVPHDIVPYGAMPRSVAARVLPAFAQWRFSPALKGGHAVSLHCVIPLQLVDGCSAL